MLTFLWNIANEIYCKAITFENFCEITHNTFFPRTVPLIHSQAFSWEHPETIVNLKEVLKSVLEEV